MESLPSQEKVILVGHSFGGISISLAMERFPHKISVAVFVAAFVTCEKLIYTNVIPKESVKDAYKWGHRRIVFHGYKDLTLGLSLVRPHPIFNDKKLLLKETRVTKQRIGRVPKVFIITKEDNLLTEDFQMWMIESTSHVLQTKKSSPLTF